VTLGGKGNIAPFSITLGIYGVMFHTEFFFRLGTGTEMFRFYKKKIEIIVNHYAVTEDERDKMWNGKTK